MQNTVSNSANSAPPPEPATETSTDSSNTLARARAGRRLIERDIERVATLCAKQLTESESCRLLGISPTHWFSWKSRRKRDEKFGALLEKLRGERIDALVAKIEASADGKGLKQPDWRAADRLLSYLDRERFNPSSPLVQVDVKPSISEGDLQRLLARAYGEKSAKPLPPPQPMKEIPEKCESDV